MAKVKFTHMGLRGNIAISAELSRFILAAGNVDFVDDITPPNSDKWNELKPNTPYLSLPVLYYDDLVLAQTMTIARFLAKKTGLIGKSDVEQAQADMIVDSVNDVQAFTSKIRLAPDSESRSAAVSNLLDNVLPSFFRLNEKILKDRGGRHFAGNRLSYADIYFFLLMDTLSDPAEATFKGLDNSGLRVDEAKFPHLADLVKRVRKHPAIVKFYKERNFAEDCEYKY